MTNQNEKIKKLLELIKENPGLRIVPIVEAECVGGDDYGWWVSTWGSASIEELYERNEKIYIRSRDEDKLIDELYDNYEGDMSDDDAYFEAKKIVGRYPWEKVIEVNIHPG